MKYTYAYKSSDGTRHEASIEAESREAVFETLRAQGIRPIKVVAADGSKANGEIRGVRKRVVAAIVVFAVLLVGNVAYFGGMRSQKKKGAEPAFVSEQTRRYPIGDAAIIEKGILTGWGDVFQEEGERFLASFAVPGVKAGQRNTTIGEIEAALARSIAATPDDSMEARQIKSMVEGMKAEARAYVAAGGSIVEYGKRLTERQDAEIAVYERAKADLARAKQDLTDAALIEYWEELNGKLHNLGIRSITLESLE